MFNCEFCSKNFTRKDNCLRHSKTCSIKRSANNVDSSVNKKIKLFDSKASVKVKEKTVYCELCQLEIISTKISGHLKSDAHKKKLLVINYSKGIEKVSSAFKSKIITFRVHAVNSNPSIEEYFDSRKSDIIELLNKQREILNAYKFNFQLYAKYVKRNIEGDILTEIMSFITKNVIITLGDSLEDKFEKMSQDIITKSEDFQERDSGWALENVEYLEINFNKYAPLKASSYISLPKNIASKKAIINIQNNDDKCFIWSVIAALFPTEKNPQRTSTYSRYISHLNLEGLEFPVKLRDIKIFEKFNDISVNVYGLENNEIIGPLYYTSNKKKVHVNLLYLEKDDRSHYCLIKNISRLLRTKLSKHNEKKWICDGCLLYFRNENLLNRHMMDDCNKVRTFLPDITNNILKYEHYEKQLNVPFVVYADFESILIPISTCSPESSTSYTQPIQLHQAYSFAFYLKCSFDESKDKFEIYRGLDCEKVFMQKLEDIARNIHQILNTIVPMKPLTSHEKFLYETAKICHICNENLNEDKVCDHDHLTGLFRGAAHAQCNLKYTTPKFIPVILHNLSGYDSHFIVREMSDVKTDVIANNMEKYVSFTKYVTINEKENIKLRFIDSFRFMPSSLQSIAVSMVRSELKNINKFFTTEERFNLMREKGIFPYEYVDSFERLNEQELPPQNAFYSSLNSENITDSEYLRAKKIWNEFDIKNLGEYSDLYLKTDVLLLTDIFENFRSVSLRIYGLDPAHYFTAPGFGCDSMLKKTKVELELLTDIDMIHFLKCSIRGGLCQCIGKFSKANNKYLPSYDRTKPNKYLMYIDANNQYGWAMIQHLPINNFRWLDENEIDKIIFQDVSDTNEKGYILEVDLNYPTELHFSHNDLPFCPENIIPPLKNSKNKKLVASFTEKNKYVLHYRNLKQCLQQGLELKKIYRVLEFNQSPWLKPYIELNNNLRIKAKSTFEKNNYKLMNNIIFGKTIENVDNRIDVKLITKWNESGKRLSASRLINMLHFNSRSIIHEDLVVVKMNKTRVFYNKPIYIGFSVLEISKILMYDFHYNYIKIEYNDNANLLYMDTDSFVYEIETEDIYEDMKKNLERFDTSDYEKNNIYNIAQVNKKILGKFKDECANDIILMFVGLKAKTYCILTVNDIIKKIKGIKKSVVKQNINVDDFINCIKDQSLQIMKKMMTFRSRKHRIYTELVNKIALRNNDDKRFALPDSFNTLAWGHHDIDKYYFL